MAPNGIDHESSDVLIVGGGVVGCLTAIKLAQAGIDVQIIEKEDEISDAPRACGYFGPVVHFLDELGLYQMVRKEGFLTRGLVWRTPPKDVEGGKRHGDIVAIQRLCGPGEMTVGSGMLNLTQAKLNKLLLREALKLGVKIDFGVETVALDGAVVTTRKRYRAKYIVGVDGAHSFVRKGMGLPFPGHTWGERFLATNVRISNVDLEFPTYFYMAEKYWGISTPLEEPIVGKKTLWRFVIVIPPDDARSDEELFESIGEFYELRLPGPRPLDYVLEAKSMYRVHQRCAATLRKGNCLLAGDAAHVCNPVGGLGLNTGILDADALAEALIMVLKEGRSEEVLDVYADERRKVFQFFVDPLSTQNKIRVHSHPPETAAETDWLLRMLAKGPTEEQTKEMLKPFFETWRTDLRKAAKDVS